MGDISGARADLASVLSMEPGNQAARDEITELAHVSFPFHVHLISSALPHRLHRR